MMQNAVQYAHQVRHTLKSPVFVIGHARSGTSMMTRLLKTYLHVNFGSESQFFIRFHRKLKNYGDLTRGQNLRALIRDVSKERCFNKWEKKYGFVLNRERVFRETPEPTFSAVVETIFRQFADYQEMPRWGDKTPEYIYHLPTLKALFPKAQFIHIVRDGRDVALSNFRAPFGAKNFVVAAAHWKHQMLLVRDFFNTLPGDQYVEVRYEELLLSPETVFLDLLNFLGVEDRDSGITHHIIVNIRNDLLVHNIKKWKPCLTYRQRLQYERVAADVLQLYGYETWLDKPDEPNLAERLFWEFDNYIRKRANFKYWKDNYYKARVRLRLLSSPFRRIFA